MNKTKSLSLSTLTQEQHERTCGYWYIVEDYHSPHTAFRTREALLRWLDDRNIKLTKDLPAHGEHSYQHLDGQYATRYVGGLSDIQGRIEDNIMVLHNAEYTVGYVTHEDGFRVINVISRGNPRMVFDYRIAQEYADTGKRGFPDIFIPA